MSLLLAQFSAPAVYTLTAALATFSLSGQVVAVKAGRAVASSVGAFIHSGQSAGLFTTKKLVSSVGAFVDGGQAVGLFQSKKVSASPGAFVEGGQSAVLTRQRSLAVSSQQYSEAGSSDLAWAHILASNQAAFVESGKSAVFNKGLSFAVSVGTFAVGEQAATINTQKRIGANNAAFADSGQNAGLRSSRNLSALKGDFIFSGIVADLLTGAALNHAIMVAKSRDVLVFSRVGVNLTRSHLSSNTPPSSTPRSVAGTSQSANRTYITRLPTNFGQIKTVADIGSIYEIRNKKRPNRRN